MDKHRVLGGRSVSLFQLGESDRSLLQVLVWTSTMREDPLSLPAGREEEVPAAHDKAIRIGPGI